MRCTHDISLASRLGFEPRLMGLEPIVLAVTLSTQTIKEKREPYPKFSLIGAKQLTPTVGAERLIQHDNIWVYLLNANPKRPKKLIFQGGAHAYA